YLSATSHDLPSFPTRRSSDLGLAEVAGRPTGCTADRRGLPEPGVAEESFDGRARGPQALGHHSARGTHRTSKTRGGARGTGGGRSEEHTSELQSRFDLVCRLL